MRRIKTESGAKHSYLFVSYYLAWRNTRNSLLVLEVKKFQIT